MSLWPELRAVAWIKRAALALESIAESQTIQARAAVVALAPRPAPTMTVFEQLDLSAAEKEWFERERIEREEAGDTEVDA